MRLVKGDKTSGISDREMTEFCHGVETLIVDDLRGATGVKSRLLDRPRNRDGSIGCDNPRLSGLRYASVLRRIKPSITTRIVQHPDGSTTVKCSGSTEDLTFRLSRRA